MTTPGPLRRTAVVLATAIALLASALVAAPSIAAEPVPYEGVLEQIRVEPVDEPEGARPPGLQQTADAPRVAGRSGGNLRGSAERVESDLTWTYDAAAEELLAVDDAGQVQQSYDASEVGLTDVQAIAFGPTSNLTDDPAAQSLFVTDGDAVRELSLDPLVTAFAAVTGQLVRTTATSSYSPPSPDSAGVAYMPGPDRTRDRLLISDSEVNEMPLYQGVNLFGAQLNGTQDTTRSGTTVGWSNEPTGIGYDPVNNHVFVSDDDYDRIFQVRPGPDGRHGTSDDTVTNFSVRSIGNGDAEGVDYDPTTTSIFVVDGVNRRVYRYQPSGALMGSFDVGGFGARDPEGIAYDPVRDTIAIVDDATKMIYELTKTGTLLNTINVSATGGRTLAGLAVAPGSTSTNERNYYIVDRGVDNDSDPTENDGRLYEIRASLPPIGGGTTNTAPVVEAGPNQTITLPAGASLHGTVTDDGRPDPPGAVTITWTRASGPGTVTFANPNAAVTTATFSTSGTYVLRLTATDGALTTSDDVTITVNPADTGGGGGGTTQTLQIPIATGSDDAEERVSTGVMDVPSSDLEITYEGSGSSSRQAVGLRFTGVAVPAGATITGAHVQFQVDEATTGATTVTIRGQAADNPPTFTTTTGNITSRPLTSTAVTWTPPDWPTVDARGPEQATPDLKAVVQEIVNRPGWTSGNALALILSGDGKRVAEAFEGSQPGRPVLNLTYTTGTGGGGGGGGGGTTNTAPEVEAGPNQTITLPAGAILNGTVYDDGLPNPPGTVTTTWTRASGPGTVTFANPNTEDTTATFSTAGTYVLRLTASDGALTTSDDVTITVNPADTTPTNIAPVVNAGSDQNIAPSQSASLSGTVFDDGLPNPPGQVTTVWTKVSGPGDVAFVDPSNRVTSATFSASGDYTLRLTASDSQLSASDDVVVKVRKKDPGPSR